MTYFGGFIPRAAALRATSPAASRSEGFAVLVQLVIEAISKAENVIATDEDIEAEIVKYAENGGTDVETFKAQITDADREYFADRVTVDKTVKLIVDAAVETEEPEKAE